MNINELFTQSLPYNFMTSEGGRRIAADFRVDDTAYEIEFISNRRSTYQCGFHAFNKDLEPTIEIIGNRKQFPVFATVITIIKDFIRQYQPSAIMFTASEDSRKRLYRRLLSRLSVPGYTYDNSLDGVFEIHKGRPPSDAPK
jgi:hypothetical protein